MAVQRATPPPTEEDRTVCPRFRRALELIGRRWTGAILRVLAGGPARFHVLVTAVPGISERLLSERLRELETEHLVERTVLPGPPVAVEYRLTESGLDLGVAMTALGDWSDRWIPAKPSVEV